MRYLSESGTSSNQALPVFLGSTVIAFIV